MHITRLPLAVVAAFVALVPVENALGKPIKIELTDAVQECLFGGKIEEITETGRKNLLQYVELLISGATDFELDDADAQKCYKDIKLGASRVKEFEISAYDIEDPGSDYRDYDVKFAFSEGPENSLPYLSQQLKWSTKYELYGAFDEIDGNEERQERRVVGFRIGSIKYKRWKKFEPYLTLGYFNLDKEVSNAITGQVTEDSNTDNFSLTIGADVELPGGSEIKFSHHVGTEGVFGSKTLSKTGASYQVSWD